MTYIEAYRCDQCTALVPVRDGLRPERWVVASFSETDDEGVVRDFCSWDCVGYYIDCRKDDPAP